MLEYLKGIIARLRSADPGAPPMSPPDPPDARIRQPRSGRRPGGSAAAAVAEPDEERTATAAISRNR